MKKRNSIRFMVQGASIAALYIALTFLSSALGLSNGVIQVRFSEALCVLPIFTPAAIPGLFVGCFLANILTGSVLVDVVFGSLATLLGAILTRVLRRKKFWAVLPPILSNALIIPFVLKFAYGVEGSIWFFMVTVGVCEIISCGVLGSLLMMDLKKRGNIF